VGIAPRFLVVDLIAVATFIERHRSGRCYHLRRSLLFSGDDRVYALLALSTAFVAHSAELRKARARVPYLADARAGAAKSHPTLRTKPRIGCALSFSRSESKLSINVDLPFVSAG
jgi:hypothetical protein